MKQSLDLNETRSRLSLAKSCRNLLLEIIVFLLVFCVIEVLLLILAGFLMGGAGEISQLNMFLMQSVSVIACVGAVYAVYRWRHIPISHLGFSLRGYDMECLMGMIMAILIYALGFVIMILSDTVRFEGGMTFYPIPLLQWFFYFLLVAVFEEVMCRGFLLGRMIDAGINKFAALALSSALFAGLHLANPNMSALPVVNLFLAGVLLGSNYIYSRNLSFAIMMHWFWNWLQGPVIGFSVSGMDISSQETVIHWKPVGSELINGGDFGFEGSLICSLLMVISIICIVSYHERKGERRSKRNHRLFI